MYSRPAQRILSCEECLLSAPCCDTEDGHRHPPAHSPKAAHRMPSPSHGHGPATAPPAFCCDEPECLPALGGLACDGGPACPSASFVGWDIPIDDCEACISQPGVAGPSSAPYDPFGDCCDEACFTLPDLALGTRRAPPVDCPDCWAEPSGSTAHPRSDDDGVTETDSSVATPGVGESASPLHGSSKHLMGLEMDDRVIQEILDCCCNDQAQHHHDPAHSFHSYHAHQLPPTPDDLSTHLPHLFPSLPTVVAFPCKWSECKLSFATKDLLTTHVNGDHLAPSLGPPHPPSNAFHISSGPPEGSTAFARCLWDECATGVPTAPPLALDQQQYPLPLPWDEERSPVSAQVQDATSLLLKHLLEEHLAKLEPGLALAWSSSLLPKALLPASRLSPFPPTPQSPSTPIPADNYTAADVSYLPSLPDANTDHSLRHAHLRPPPEPHSHSHPSPHLHTGKAVRHSHDAHRHHGHPYGVHPRVASAVAPPPQPSATGEHLCRWRSCSLSFDTSAELMNHLSVEHVGSGKAGYVCEWEGCDRCDDAKGFAQRQKVMRHLQTHTGDRPFVCDTCSKSFSEATTLTQHIRIHTQEKPYKCTHDGCEKAFALASALTIHLRTHSGSKPFLCPFPGCTSAFSESSNLSKHVRTHKGEKGYGCEECGKAFSRSDQLARHKKIHAKQRG